MTQQIRSRHADSETNINEFQSAFALLYIEIPDQNPIAKTPILILKK